jgi:hypothetical protein
MPLSSSAGDQYDRKNAHSQVTCTDLDVGLDSGWRSSFTRALLLRMHRALLVQEIVEAIVGAIPVNSLSTYFALALTSRSTFLDIALDHLWGHPDVPLYFLAITMPGELLVTSQITVAVSGDKDAYYWNVVCV